uniref:Uncharacterized protein n=1 Tax=Anopheles maculatus TaxID=74869 RepID=A0A182SYL8_9DIPT
MKHDLKSLSLVVAAEPKVAVPETLAEEPKLVEKEAAEQLANDKPKTKAVESIKVEETKDASVEVNKKEETKPVDPVVKTVAEEKAEKLTEVSKPDVSSESTQARSTTSDLEAEQPKTDFKSEEKVADQVAVKVVVEPVAEEKPTVEQPQEVNASEPEVKSATIEDAKPAPSAANDPEPQTEGKDESKPTKVRAAPIVEGLKVSQPVEAEPAVTKIHVTVIQEEVELDGKSGVQKEAVQNDAPVTAEAEEKGTEPSVTTTTTPEQAVKSVEPTVEKASETKDEVNNDKPSAVKSVEPVVETKPEAAATVEASKEDSSARSATTETVVIV